MGKRANIEPMGSIPSLSPRVDQCIHDVMERFPGYSASSQARYFEEVHQHLAPLARQLEAELNEARRINEALREQWQGQWRAAHPTTQQGESDADR